MLALGFAVTNGFAPMGPLVHPMAPAATRLAPLRMNQGPATRDPEGDAMSPYERYMASKSQTEIDATDAAYRSFKGIDQEFDGGDSGGGVVGDGNTDLEDQHNSATLGALRGGIADVTAATMAVGRGNVRTLDDIQYDGLNDADEFTKTEEGATSSRTASAGANYYGRSTGLAEKLINEITDDDLKTGRMDKVRAQQKENWFNQRAIHAQNRMQGQGVVFGEEEKIRPSQGGWVAREHLGSEAYRKGAKEGEISQRDLANHMKELSSQKAERLDGEEWGALELTEADSITQTFDMRASPRQTDVKTIQVSNDYNTFAPYRCEFLMGSSVAFSVTPNHGTMNRRSGEAVEVVVRFTPQETGTVSEAMLVFETEDMKKCYHFIGST